MGWIVWWDFEVVVPTISYTLQFVLFASSFTCQMTFFMHRPCKLSLAWVQSITSFAHLSRLAYCKRYFLFNFMFTAVIFYLPWNHSVLQWLLHHIPGHTLSSQVALAFSLLSCFSLTELRVNPRIHQTL